jgi:hypothetical protein
MLQWLNVCKLLGGYSTVLEGTKPCARCKAIHVPSLGPRPDQHGERAPEESAERLRRGRRPTAWSSDPATGCVGEVRQHGEALLGEEEKTAGQSAAAVAATAASAATATACLCGFRRRSQRAAARASRPARKQEHQPQQAQTGSDRPGGIYEVNADSPIRTYRRRTRRERSGE